MPEPQTFYKERFSDDLFHFFLQNITTDTITNATRYAVLHPDFVGVIHLLQTLDFAALPDGQMPCKNPNIRLFVGSEPMRSKAGAKPGAHLKHINI